MIRVLVVLLLCALVCPGPVKAQVPNLLVSVQLQGVGAVDVEAVLTADSTPLLPAAPVSELLGLPPPTSQWVTVAQLQKQFPPIQVQWIPRQLTVLIQDDVFALPASRRTRDGLIRQAQGAAPYAVTRSGPFAAVAGDNLGKTLVDLGYSFRGRAAIAVRRSSTRGTSTTISVPPVPLLFASVAAGAGQQPIPHNSCTTRRGRSA